MIDFLMIIGFLVLFLGLPASIIVTIMFLIKKKKVLIPAICIPITFWIGVIAIGVGGTLYGETDEYQQQMVEQESEEEIAAEIQAQEDANIDNVEEVQEAIQKDNESATVDGNNQTEETTSKEMTEQEYKSACEEVFYDDVFGDSLKVGQNIKFYGFISGIYEYRLTSTFGMVVEDTAEEYNLDTKYIESCVMHEETKNNSVPSYFGESLYIMFPKDCNLSVENYSSGQKFIVYGEVVQTWSGTFVIPKYIESGE